MSKELIYVNDDKHSTRWVCYLDLLGFTEIVRKESWLSAFSYYTGAVERQPDGFGNIEKTWFSDTFLLYSPDDTGASFTWIDSTARWFVFNLITAGIPVRGCMSCGDLYADKENNIYLGQTLLEAYHYGESQDWIGFILSPSVITKLASFGLKANKMLNYAFWEIPYNLH